VKRSGKTARLLAAAGLMCLVLSGVTVAGATPATTAASTPCAPGATCVTIPCTGGTNCPSVSAEPTTLLLQAQWIYVNASDFPAGSTVYLYFCSNTTPLTSTNPPYCLQLGTPGLAYPVQNLPIAADGTGQLSFQTTDDPDANGDAPLIGKIPGDSSAPSKNFFCGDAADPCSVDAVDPTLLPPGTPNSFVPVPADTAVIPLGFAPQSAGCPAATFVTTSSDYSMGENDQLLQHESPVVCAGKSPALALNTPTSTDAILPDLANDGVVFLDDPQAADVQAALATAHYTVVPLVASAVVMGYVAGMEAVEGAAKFPYDSFELTPNQVAGLVSYNYQGPYNADLVKCGNKKCSALEGLNTVPGFTMPTGYGVFIPSETTSVTEALTEWMCNAPNVPFTLNGTVITDPNTAANTLTHAINNYQSPWPIKTCTAFDTFPAMTPYGTLYDPAGDPLHAIKFLRTYAIPPEFQPTPAAGFAPLDWADALFGGLNTASLQNAEGQFVAPTAASITAEVSAETVSPDGYPLPDPTLKVSGGYPMSTVIDALVPDTLLPAAEATPIAEMMDELLNYTTTGSLPGGFVPLPTGLATLAHTQLAKALTAENAGRVSTTTTAASVSPSAAAAGKSVTYSATVTASTGTPTGTVAFSIGSTLMCSATLLDGKATCVSPKAPVGVDTVTAKYAGTTGFDASTTTVALKVAATSSTTVTTEASGGGPYGGGGGGGGGVPTGGQTGTTVAGTVPTTTVGSVATQTKKPTKKSAPDTLRIADVTLTGAAAHIALPAALAAGGILIALSLGLSFVGFIRRRHSDGAESA
jgi:hypothetical protein